MCTGGLVIDRSCGTVSKHGIRLRLPPADYVVLDALAAQAGSMVPHAYLERLVVGEGAQSRRTAVTACVRRLREHLEDDPRAPQYVMTEWGYGYRLARLPLVVSAGRDTDA